MKREIVLATRGSALARAQAVAAGKFIEGALPGTQTSVSVFTTTGDRQTEWTLSQYGGKGLFTKELEDALLGGRADLAIHSAKDLPTELKEGLAIAGFLPREDPRDVLVRREDCEQPRRIASGSPRRREQGAKLWPDAEWTEVRGNVDTRLRKVAEGRSDATILAMAGLKRLGISGYPGLVFEPIPVDKMVPAAGQAAIAVECCRDDLPTYAPIFNEATFLAVSVERTLLAALGGGCNSASAAYFDGATLRVHLAGKGVFAVPFQAVCPDEAREKLKSVLERLARAQ
jgi:hydroxymethylbilane synthase